jgi:hypothetical protein
LDVIHVRRDDADGLFIAEVPFRDLFEVSYASRHASNFVFVSVAAPALRI